MPIVRDGVLAGFLSSRETATEIGLERSGGCMRADGFARQPIVRMTNVNLEPGEAGTLAELIADTPRGILIDANRSWSIDDRRLHFQFEGETAREIRDGSLAGCCATRAPRGLIRLLGRPRRRCSRSEWRLPLAFSTAARESRARSRLCLHGLAPRPASATCVGSRGVTDPRHRGGRRAACAHAEALAHVAERSLMLGFALRPDPVDRCGRPESGWRRRPDGTSKGRDQPSIAPPPRVCAAWRRVARGRRERAATTSSFRLGETARSPRPTDDCDRDTRPGTGQRRVGDVFETPACRREAMDLDDGRGAAARSIGFASGAAPTPS